MLATTASIKSLPSLCIRADVAPYMLSAAACSNSSAAACCCCTVAAQTPAIFACDLQARHVGHAARQAAWRLQAAAAGAANAVLAVPAGPRTGHQKAQSGVRSRVA